jgi:glycosyltransferase involved in cell wall biosynthesis
MEMARDGAGGGGAIPELSVIVPMHNEEGNVGLLAERIRRALEAEGLSYEVLFIDDGSTDGSVAAVEGLARAMPEIRLVRLARNFGKEAAMLAGYDRVRGRAVVVLDADLQQPPELFPEMLALWRRGYDVVHAVRADTAGISPIRRFASTAFYWVNGQLAGVQIPSNAADFGLMDRAVVEVLRQCREQHRFNRALVAWAGFRNTAITYTAATRHSGRTHWNWGRLLRYAMDGILSFSVRPLRLVGLLGGLVSALSFAYLTLVAILRIGWPELAGAGVGYASIIGMISLLGGFQLLGIWLLGEYIGRIYEQSKGRPAYIIREDRACRDDRTWRADPASSHQPVGHPARITDAV